MKTVFLTTSVVLVFMFISTGRATYAQESGEPKDRNFKIELEPASFALRGFGLSGLYAITKDNKLNLGFHASMLDVPVWSRESMFTNVGGDTSSVRLGLHIGLMTRYKLEIFPDWESNPYIGLILAYEYFDINQPAYPSTLRLSTFVATPYVGYEVYFFKQMLFVNPQLRSVLYFGSSSSDELRPETMGKFFLLPQISIGVRF